MKYFENPLPKYIATNKFATRQREILILKSSRAAKPACRQAGICRNAVRGQSGTERNSRDDFTYLLYTRDETVTTGF